MRVNPAFLRKGNLKKQSQFVPGRIDVKSYMKGDYNIIPLTGHKKTKPICNEDK